MTDLKSCSNLDSEGHDDHFLRDLSKVPSDRIYSIYLGYPSVEVKLADGRQVKLHQEQIIMPSSLSQYRSKYYKNCYDIHDLWWTITNLGSSRRIAYQDIMDTKVKVPILTTGSYYSKGMLQDIQARVSKYYDPKLIYEQLVILTSIVHHKYVLPHISQMFNVYFASGSPLLTEEQFVDLTKHIRMFQIVNDVSMLVDAGHHTVVSNRIAGTFKHYGSKLNDINLDFLVMNTKQDLASGWNALSPGAKQHLVSLGNEIITKSYRNDILAQLEGKLVVSGMMPTDLATVNNVIRPSIICLISLARLRDMLNDPVVLDAIKPYFPDLIITKERVMNMRTKLVPELIKNVNDHLQTMKSNFKNYFKQ